MLFQRCWRFLAVYRFGFLILSPESSSVLAEPFYLSRRLGSGEYPLGAIYLLLGAVALPLTRFCWATTIGPIAASCMRWPQSRVYARTVNGALREVDKGIIERRWHSALVDAYYLYRTVAGNQRRAAARPDDSLVKQSAIGDGRDCRRRRGRRHGDSLWLLPLRKPK